MLGHYEGFALVAKLVKKMRDYGSWCGETHIQKSVYFLKTLFKIPIGFDFVLYFHGPFSFELRDALMEMRFHRILDYSYPLPPYGPSYVPGVAFEEFLKAHGGSLDEYEGKIIFVAKEFSPLNVAGLERISMAMYVCGEKPELSAKVCAEEIHRLKPHISSGEAEFYLGKLDEKKGMAAKILSRRTKG